MIHTYSQAGRNIVLDVPSGAVFSVDEAAYTLLQSITPPMTRQPPDHLSPDERDIWDELYILQEEGLLFSQDFAPILPGETPLKALCMHVSHDCNLRCGYCFAGTGHFGSGDRSLMTPEIAEGAIDFLLRRCGDRRNLEIDFFGGEPLLAMDTVRHTVTYARKVAPEKNFRFTITTNGLALDEDTIDFINREMDNVVLSLDGRPEVNDALRRTPAGEGSYAAVLPKFQKLLETRTGEYTIRGTYTARNLDFVKDVVHLADRGFRSISIEPVVLPPGHALALREEHLPELYRRYEALCAQMAAGADFNFFHFNVDLDQGPCIYKRLRGCGAGYEYAAVTPEGELYPCHRFVGMPDYRLGSVLEDSFSHELAKTFRDMNVFTKKDCADCWAKYYCSGGCAASNLTVNGRLAQSDWIGCALEKKRLECAILLKTIEKEGENP